MDAGVRCAGTTCTQGALQLIGGGTSGRVKVCNKNAWGDVCGDDWTDTEPKVVCRELRLPSSSMYEREFRLFCSHCLFVMYSCHWLHSIH